ncbi:MAG: peptidylprolyl isomerase [Shewanella sp.]|jgi:peptidylprolyl isomerase
MKMILAVVVIAGVIFYFFTSMSNQKAAKENIELGTAFLAENKLKEGVSTTASGLQYQVLAAGDGTVHPKASDTVTVHYHGTLIDGTVFDSSVERGEPIGFPLNRVIKGWTEGVQLMVVGEKTRFFIPSELAYGNRSAGKISGGSTLIFDVELISID